jgi:RecA-family ATPase
MEYDMPPQRWAVEGLVPTGLTILAGRPKLGKSWFAFDACLAVATGGTVLGHQAKQGTALYLALEDTERRLQERAHKLLGNHPAPRGLRIKTLWDRLDRGGLVAVEQFLDTYPDTRLIVIDVIKKVAPPHNATKSQYAYDYALVSSLKKLADAHGVAIVAITHATKFEDDDDPFTEIAGSTGTTGAMDTGIVLRQHRREKHMELCLRGRDVEEQRFPVTFDKATCRWQSAARPHDPFADISLTPEQRKAAELLLEHMALTPKQLALLLVIKADAAQIRLNKLVECGVAVRVGKGVYRIADKYLPDDEDGVDTVDAPLARAG